MWPVYITSAGALPTCVLVSRFHEGGGATGAYLGCVVGGGGQLLQRISLFNMNTQSWTSLSLRLWDKKCVTWILFNRLFGRSKFKVEIFVISRSHLHTADQSQCEVSCDVTTSGLTCGMYEAVWIHLNTLHYITQNAFGYQPHLSGGGVLGGLASMYLYVNKPNLQL